MSQSNLRVLSIQSHVVSGYVGNKSATFPLQLLGFEVDPLNSVSFSNHSGYKVIRKGQILKESDLDEIISGLKANGLDFYTHVLTGYIFSSSFLTRIADLIGHLRKVNPNLVYVCDPVMGDNGRMYVPEELKDIYRTLIVPLADIVTPNSFEAQLLTGLPVETRQDLYSVVGKLHELGVKTVVVSSTEDAADNLIIYGSSKADGAGARTTTAEINIPKISGHFTGTGDLFAALFLAWFHRSDLPTALEKATSTVQAVLKRTNEYVESLGGGEGSKHDRELKIIQSKADIENPEVVHKAVVKIV